VPREQSEEVVQFFLKKSGGKGRASGQPSQVAAARERKIETEELNGLVCCYATSSAK
jgi:hypothetical protein